MITVKRFKNDFQQSIEPINTITLKKILGGQMQILKQYNYCPNALAKTKAKVKMLTKLYLLIIRIISLKEQVQMYGF